MNIFQKIIISIAFLILVAIPAIAQQCDIEIGYADVSQGEYIPEVINERLKSKLTSVLAREGISSTDSNSRFFVTARFDHAYSEVVPAGMGYNYMIKTELTLYMGDNMTQKVFASAVLNLKGVGSTEERAYMQCLNKITINNPELRKFIITGREKIVEYYDANYKSLLAQANSAMAARRYDEALYYSTGIPECCAGFAQAQNFTLKCYENMRNFDSANYLNMAKSAWAQSPDYDGAAEAAQYLQHIDPSSPSAAGAKTLQAEMTKVTKRQWEFENIQKYKDELELQKFSMTNEAEIEKRRLAHDAEIRKANIRAARDIAVSYNNSRPRVEHHYHWLTW